MLFQQLFDLCLTRPFFQYQFHVLLIPTPEAIAKDVDHFVATLTAFTNLARADKQMSIAVGDMA